MGCNLRYIGIPTSEHINTVANGRSVWQIFVRIVQDAHARENAITG